MSETTSEQFLSPKINLGTPDLKGILHWNNSSNVLCNYMRKPDYLKLILKNQAIIPRYVMEPVEYLNLGLIRKICFPMTCFCDIPFSKVGIHMFNYGEYGIALDKAAMLKKYRIQPIHYISDNSPLIDDFRKAFLSFYHSNEPMEETTEVLLDYIVSTLVYMKPIWGQKKDANGNLVNYVYQDECEWRYIPSDHFPQELEPLILPQNRTTEAAKDIYIEAIAKHRECWLHFDWSDVRYLIVADEKGAKDIINTIQALTISDDEKHLLMAKIEISQRFSDNM